MMIVLLPSGSPRLSSLPTFPPPSTTGSPVTVQNISVPGFTSHLAWNLPGSDWSCPDSLRVGQCRLPGTAEVRGEPCHTIPDHTAMSCHHSAAEQSLGRQGQGSGRDMPGKSGRQLKWMRRDGAPWRQPLLAHCQAPPV